jgi:hypothetical protein
MTWASPFSGKTLTDGDFTGIFSPAIIRAA